MDPRNLSEHPGKRVAFDVNDAPVKPETGDPVSVVLAVRHGDHILTGELRIPRQRWDMSRFVRAKVVIPVASRLIPESNNR